MSVINSTRRQGVPKDPSERKRLLLLLKMSARDPRPTSRFQGRPVLFSPPAALLLPLCLTGFLSLLPLPSLADHQARLAAHEAKIAAAAQKLTLKEAKLHDQHIALASGNVVAAAYAFRGSRYVMGGTSRSGFDCSGFVRYILSNAGGVDVPRTAVEQFTHGAPIAPDAMQPGDLVFFKNTYKHGISHVGIYAGNGQFIHAANAHKGVRMDSLSESYYAAHFAGARRVLPAQMRAASFLDR